MKIEPTVQPAGLAARLAAALALTAFTGTIAVRESETLVWAGWMREASVLAMCLVMSVFTGGIALGLIASLLANRWPVLREVRFSDGLPEHWEARLFRRIIGGWRAEGWYDGPDVPYPGMSEQIIVGFGGWTEAEARQQVTDWIRGTDAAPHEDWLPLRDPEDGDSPVPLDHSDAGRIPAGDLIGSALVAGLALIAAGAMLRIVTSRHGGDFTLPVLWAVTGVIGGGVLAFAITANATDRHNNIARHAGLQQLVERWKSEDEAADHAARVEAHRSTAPAEPTADEDSEAMAS